MLVKNHNLGPIICFLIMSMDIIAGVLGIEAEIAKNKMKHVGVLFLECREPSPEAFKLGLAATILLALAHVISNLLGGFVCICSKEEFHRSSANKQVATACLVLSWIILGIALPLLIIGTMANSKSKDYCGLAHNKFLSSGGILCFIHGLFCVSYYVSANATIEESSKPWHRGSAGVQMGEGGHNAPQP